MRRIASWLVATAALAVPGAVVMSAAGAHSDPPRPAKPAAPGTPATPATPAAPALRVYPVCPARDRTALVTTTPCARAQLVPPGAHAVLLCRYSGFGPAAHAAGPASFRLIAQHLISSAATTGQLASAINALPPATGVRACPADRGQRVIALFRYALAAMSDDPVTIGLSGCLTVSNGPVVRTAASAGGLRLVRRVRFLTRHAAYAAMPYSLLTHCGILGAWIRGRWWRAEHPLSDGNGNPPAGWDNPSQRGVLVFTSHRTATFTSRAGEVRFRRTNRTRAPFTCS